MNLSFTDRLRKKLQKNLHPQTLKRMQRFCSIKRGLYSLIVFSLLILFSLFAELFISNRALVVRYDHHWYFPTYNRVYDGKTFGLDYDYETNYRDLKKHLSEAPGSQERGDFVWLPLVPYSAYENDLQENIFPPTKPDLNRRHLLGTDTAGRDIFARLIYGFRIAIAFSIILLTLEYAIGVSLGSLMGFFGGKFDLFFQRIIEIWSNIPFLYVVIIISSLITPDFKILVATLLFFGWMGMTWYLRTATYKEKSRDYVLAARAMGASPARIIFKHILPNTLSIIITFIPFSVASGITVLTSLDYLGFGLPAPTPSWGELLHQGTQNLSAYWLAASVVVCMIAILVMVTFMGEAIREAFDPKKHTLYE